MNTEIEKFADYLIELIISKHDREFDRISAGCKDNNQEYRDMPNSLIEPMLKEWVSPDGVHYWIYSDDYCSGLTPRYDNKGNLVIESNYLGY